MSSYRSSSVTARPARRIARGLLATLALLSLNLPVRADVTLYQAVVPVQGGTEADRNAAFGEALKAAAVRASGHREAATNSSIVAAAADPSRYVQQYSMTTERTLRVGFDGRALQQLLQQAALPLWPSERPVTTIYLYPPAGNGRAVGPAERVPERAEIEQAAQYRGVPVAWASDPVDAAGLQARAGAADAAHATLVGMASAVGYDWVFAHAGQSARTQGSLADGLDLAADTLASRYAPASTRGFSTVMVRVGNVTDVRAYAALTRHLQGLSLVRSLATAEFTGDTVQLRLELRGDLELLRRIVALDAAHLQPGVAAAPSAVTTPGSIGPDFIWQP